MRLVIEKEYLSAKKSMDPWRLRHRLENLTPRAQDLVHLIEDGRSGKQILRVLAERYGGSRDRDAMRSAGEEAESLATEVRRTVGIQTPRF